MFIKGQIFQTVFQSERETQKPPFAKYVCLCSVPQSGPTLCDPIDCPPPGSSVHGIFQARILEWVAIYASKGNLPNPEIEPVSPELQAGSLLAEPPGKPRKNEAYLLSLGEGNGTPFQYSCLEDPWTEEPSRLQSMGSLRVGHDWAPSLSLFTFMHWRRKWQPTPVFLPGESQGQRSLMGCCLWGRRVGHDWSDLA